MNRLRTKTARPASGATLPGQVVLVLQGGGARGLRTYASHLSVALSETILHCDPVMLTCASKSRRRLTRRDSYAYGLRKRQRLHLIDPVWRVNSSGSRPGTLTALPYGFSER